jgi:hypothetical protein
MGIQLSAAATRSLVVKFETQIPFGNDKQKSVLEG